MNHAVNIFNKGKTNPTPDICCLDQANPKAIIFEL